MRIKICCVSSQEEVRLAVEGGAAALGFVSNMPSGPGVIPETLICQLAESVPAGVSKFLLTSETDPDTVIRQQRRCRVDTIQLCNTFPLNGYEILRENLPGISIVQVLHIQNEENIERALEIVPYVHSLLLDSGNPDGGVPELGGTGRTHNWQISAQIREAVDIPVYLAGGLNAANVREAIAAVRPFGVDVCSGVRTGGKLDSEKLKAFVMAVQTG